MAKRATHPKTIPDWRNIKDYPDPAKTSQQQFAWEFLRRNPFYQKHYQILSKYPDQHQVNAFRRKFDKDYLFSLSLRKDLPLDIIRGIIKYKREEFLNTYWIGSKFSKKLDPAVNKHPKFAPAQYPVAITAWVASSFPLDFPHIFGYPCERIFKVSLAENIDQQLRDVRAELKRDIIDNANQLDTKQLRKDYLPASPETYIMYLRILDAEAAGIPFNMLDKCVDLLEAIGNDKRPFLEIYDTATSLMCNGYRYILKMAEK